MGYPPQGLVGVGLESIVPRPGKIFFETHLIPLIALAEGIDECYFRMITSDSKEVPILLNARGSRRDFGAVVEVFGMVVKKRDQLETEMLLAQREAEGALIERDVINDALRQMTAQLEVKREQLESAYRRLEEIAEKDSLTGIWNRHAFSRKVDEAFAIKATQNQDFSLLVCDIDHFKRINDQFGHAVGDEYIAGLPEA